MELVNETNAGEVEQKKRATVYKLMVVKEGTVPYPAVSRPEVLAEIAKAITAGACQEQFWVLALDAKNKVIGTWMASQGSLTQSIVHPREVFKFAFTANAVSVAVVHNHPSGDCTPSDEDDAATKRLVSAASILAVPLIDHIIVGENKHYSYSAKGRL